MTAELISPGDARWEAVLEATPHDAYHLPAYTALVAREEGGQPAAFYAEEDGAALLVPLVLRPLPPELGAPGDWHDAASPYGYPAPLLAGGPAARHARLFRRLVEVGPGEALVSAFLRLHPLLPFPEEVLPEGARLVRHGQTLWVDLTQPWSEVERQMRPRHRGYARALASTGYQVRFDAWDDYPAFVELYRATMRRVAAAPYYWFSDRYFAGLRTALGAALHLVTVLAPDGTPAAAALFFEHAGTVQYHLGGTADEAVPHAPAKLLFHAAFRWAQARGDLRVHLGGGVGGGADSLFQFKAGFTRLRATFATVRLVLDPARFGVLLARAQERGARPPEVDDGFFPGYRRPLVPPAEQPAVVAGA